MTITRKQDILFTKTQLAYNGYEIVTRKSIYFIGKEHIHYNQWKYKIIKMPSFKHLSTIDLEIK